MAGLMLGSILVLVATLVACWILFAFVTGAAIAIAAVLFSFRERRAQVEEHQQFCADVRAIGGGRRHLRAVEAIGDEVDRDVFPTGDAA